jgi:fermentation-respiration switch protein FrsA (DUF1100 family)
MRTLLSLITVAAGCYLLLALLLFLFQNRMVFLANLPGRALTATPRDAGLDFEDVSFRTSDGVRLHGWYIPAEAAIGTVLFLHGNAGNISHRLDSVAVFHGLGLNTFIIDYRGYGRSEGNASEQGTYLDAEAAWAYLVDTRGTPADHIIVFGRSLGGAVAAWLIDGRRPAAVIIESCFSSALDMARRLYPFLPAKLITRIEYPVTDHVSRMHSPLLVIHSRDDEIIPFEMGRAIHDSAAGPRSFLEIRGDHNNGFLISRDQYVAGLDEFIRRYLPQPENS